MAARGGDKRGNDADEVVVHVPRVAQGGGAGGHDSRDKLVSLLERGVHYVQAIGCNFGQGAVVEHDDRVGVLGQTAHTEQAVVGLDDDIAILGVGEDAVRLDELLGEAVVEALKHVRAQAGAGAAGNRVQHHEALE